MVDIIEVKFSSGEILSISLLMGKCFFGWESLPESMAFRKYSGFGASGLGLILSFWQLSVPMDMTEVH